MADERPPILMFRRGSQLHPVGALDTESVMNLPVGKPLRVKVTMARNAGQHRLYFAMLQLICDNMDQPINRDHLHEWVKIKLGYAVTIKSKSGVQIIPGSIAWDKMDQPAFAEYFRKAVDLVCAEMIPGIGKQALINEARAMLGEVV